MKPINIIVACASNRVMGRKGRLPWSIPEDWRYFLDTTRGGILIMGRIAFEEMLAAGKVNSNRTFLVISRNDKLMDSDDTLAGSVHILQSVTQALEKAQAMPGTIWICGGERIYEECLPLAGKLYLTEVHAVIEGDVFFPNWKYLDWELVSERESSDENFKYTFKVMERASKG